MNILNLIGNTPLVDLSALFAEKGGEVFGKAEWMNPGGSLKDRPVKNMLLKALKSGQLTPDKIILDSSSGNAGIAYAMIGSALGQKVHIVIPGNASQERKLRIRSHGATLIETDPMEGYDEAIRHAHALASEYPDRYWLSNQYANDNNWKAHYEGTAEEILSQYKGKGRIDYFVGGVGTGGSLTGIARKLKEKIPGITIIAVRPEVWPGIEGLKPLGGPEDIIPPIFDSSLVDHYISVKSDEAKTWCQKVSKKGLFLGQSSGAYLSACSKVREELGKGSIVTLLNDLGERYFSSGLWN